MVYSYHRGWPARSAHCSFQIPLRLIDAQKVLLSFCWYDNNQTKQNKTACKYL